MLEENKRDLLKFIEIKGCYSFDFVDEFTLVAVSYDDNCLYKFTRKSVEYPDWTLASQFSFLTPKALDCIDNNVYVANNEEVFLLDKELTDRKKLYSNHKAG